MGKNGHYGRAVAFGKWLVWVKNKNRQKYVKNDSSNITQLLYAKNSSKKHLIFEK